MAAKVCQYCQFCCGIVKITTWFYCCCCLHKKENEKKSEIDVLVLGLQNSGKSHLLATLCSESVDDIQPTNGFSIKDVTLPKAIIHMKEVGGSDKIRPFWCHYMTKTQGIIFIVDGSDLGLGNIDEVQMALHELMENEQVAHKPLLIIVTKVVPDTTYVPNLVEKLQLSKLDCSFIVEFSHSIPKLKETLQKYAENVAFHSTGDNLSSDESSNPTRI